MMILLFKLEVQVKKQKKNETAPFFCPFLLICVVNKNTMQESVEKPQKQKLDALIIQHV